MDSGEPPPEGRRNWLRSFLQRHFARANVTETKNRGGAKKGNKREDGEGAADKSGASPRELTLDSSSPPLVPAHTSAAEKRAKKRHRRRSTKKPPVDPSSSLHPGGLMIEREDGEGAADKSGASPRELTLDSSSPPLVPAHTSAAEKRAKKRHRRRSTKKPPVDPSSSLHPGGLMIEPTAVSVADHERTLDAPAAVSVADADTEGWQDPPKKRHGGRRTEQAAQEIAPEPTVIEHSALKPTIAGQERHPKASVDEGPGPSSAFDIVPTPNDQPMAGAVFPVASNEWKVPKKPRARWIPIPPPPRLPRPTPPRRASPPTRSTRPRVSALQVQGDKREEEEDDGFGIKRMFELEEQEVTQDEEANEREEEEELHLNYWIKNKELRGQDKTLCLVCYLERKKKVPEIPNKEEKAIRHLRDAHKIKREHVCKRKGCWVTGRTKREIEMHQFLCHNI